MHQNVQPPTKAKFLINDVSQAVTEANLGISICNPAIVKIEGHRILMRRDHREIKGMVKILSGGGGGHYPWLGGFVGAGMLTAAVSGEVFRAPSPSTIFLAIREIGVGHPEGVLLIIGNYVGDRINFGLAMERARKENIKVRLVVVGDDCAVEKPPAAVGRRGLAGIAFVVKVAGAMAEDGRKLEDIYNACRSACFDEMSTIGFMTSTPSIPGTITTCRVPDDKISIGVNVFGTELGSRSLPAGYSAGDIVTALLDHMAAATKCLSGEDEVAVLINNLGGSCKLEEHIFSMETIKQLTARGIQIRRVISGRVHTALDMCGMSITVLSLKAPIDIVKYLDAVTTAPGWPKSLTAAHVGVVTDNEFELPIVYAGRQFPEIDAMQDDEQGPSISNHNADSFRQIIRIAAEAVMASSSAIDNHDADSGGDCGMNVRKGVEEILHALKSQDIDVKRPYTALRQLCAICEKSMPGISGNLYCLFFTAGAGAFRKMPEDADVDIKAWLIALRDGINVIMKYGMARKGDRTMLDPLIAAETAGRVAVEEGEVDGKKIVEIMAVAAEEAAEDTVSMPATVGRTGFAYKKLPDPGAFCVAVWMRAVSEATKLVS